MTRKRLDQIVVIISVKYNIKIAMDFRLFKFKKYSNCNIRYLSLTLKREELPANVISFIKYTCQSNSKSNIVLNILIDKNMMFQFY